ncbi:lectin subunit alpha-like [Calliphora vicina]|uniref:lectin subunit alpha-like n=1 Tax=Calliphora vicina TaxID=7373 RepID=UPI00325B6D8C
MHTSYANNKFYIDLELQYTWFESLAACLKMNMTLVDIDTNAKIREVSLTINDIQKNNNNNNIGDDYYVWIGAVRKQLPKNHFVWLPNGEKYVFNNKFNNKPDFQDSSDYCVELRVSPNWKWRDNSCSLKNGFVCEYSTGSKHQEQLQLLEGPKLKTRKELEELLQKELEQNQQLQQDLKNQQEEYRLQLQKLVVQNFETQGKLIQALQDKLDLKDELKLQHDLQHQLQQQTQQLKEQKLKLETDLQAEIIKQENRKQQETKEREKS